MTAPARPSLRVRTPGLLTTVQDLGRWGWQHLGVPVGGAMDVHACRAANALVGNPPEAAVLEATVAGPSLVARGPVTVALTGGPFAATLDGRPLGFDVAHAVPAGAVLDVGTRLGGARAWLAVAGGIDVPAVLGSRSTTVGVLGGRALCAGDVLPVGRRRGAARQQRVRRGAERAATGGVAILRVLPAPDARDAGAAAMDALCAGPYVVGADSNRMGYRLQGPVVPMHSHSRPSSGTVMGMLQVPPSGQPILLMADRQTTGGYPVPAIVIEADLGIAAGLAPGDACRFERCTRRDALAARLAREREWLDA